MLDIKFCLVGFMVDSDYCLIIFKYLEFDGSSLDLINLYMLIYLEFIDILDKFQFKDAPPKLEDDIKSTLNKLK